MTITREIICHLDPQHLYGDLNHFDFQGNTANQEKYKKAEVVLNKILKKTTINKKNFNIKIFATLEQHASFLNDEPDFVKMLSTFNYDDEEIIDISLPNLNNEELTLNSTKKTNEYDKLRYEKAIKIRAEKAPNSLDLAISYYGIGNTYYNLKEYNQAINYYEKAIKIQAEKAPNSLDLSDSYHNIGCAYDNKGDRKSAEKFFAQSKSIKASLEKAQNNIKPNNYKQLRDNQNQH